MSLTISLPVVGPHTFSDPVTTGAQRRYIFYTPVLGLPTGIPLDPNPRAQDLNKLVWREIRKHLLNEEGVGTPNTFHLKNKGITIVASEVRISDGKADIVFEPGEGIVDGGHTYQLLLQAQQELLDLVDGKSNKRRPKQYVKFDVLTGLRPSLWPEVSKGLNTSIQVQDYSLKNMEGKFDWLKELLATQTYRDDIAYRENEKKAYTVVDILAILDLFNARAFPNEGFDHPKRAYSGKKKVLKSYTLKPQQWESMRQLIPQILWFHDHVSMTAREIYNANNRGARGGKLVFIEQAKAGNQRFYFAGAEGENSIMRSALFPILAAFRTQVEYNTRTDEYYWVDGFDSVKSLWSSTCSDLIKLTRKLSEELGRDVSYIGRSTSHWSNLHSLVAKKSVSHKKTVTSLPPN